MIQVDLEKCTGCGACLDACSNEAISLCAGKAVIDLGTCLDCGACAPACPVGAISQAELPIPVEPAPVRPIVAQQAQVIKVSDSHKLAPWAETALAFMGREIAPRVVDVLIAALDRKLSRPANPPVRTSQPSLPQGRTASSRVRRQRRRAGWRL